MLKNILKVGKALSKTQQQTVSGGKVMISGGAGCCGKSEGDSCSRYDNGSGCGTCQCDGDQLVCRA